MMKLFTEKLEYNEYGNGKLRALTNSYLIFRQSSYLNIQKINVYYEHVYNKLTALTKKF